MDPSAKRTLGRTGVELSAFGFGGAPIGELFLKVTEEDAQSTLAAAWESGVRFYDTSPWYGRGLSEHRLGQFLYQQDRQDFILSTKVGRTLSPARDPNTFDRFPWTGGLPFEVRFDYSYDGIMRSYEDSIQRLRLTSIDLLLIHDLDFMYHAPIEKVQAYLTQLVTSGWRALDELRASGLIKGIGAGINEMGMVPRFLDLVDIDFFLIAMPYTLLQTDTLDLELPRCAERDVGVIIGAVFSSGILATGAVAGAKFNYADPPPEIIEKVKRMEQVCARHGVPLAAAALQFPFGHPSVAAVIPGAFQPKHVSRNLETFRHPIPPDLWSDLKSEGLLREDAPTP